MEKFYLEEIATLLRIQLAHAGVETSTIPTAEALYQASEARQQQQQAIISAKKRAELKARKVKK